MLCSLVLVIAGTVVLAVPAIRGNSLESLYDTPYSSNPVPFHIMEPSTFDGFRLCDVTHTNPKHGHITLALPLFSQHPWHTTASDAKVIFVPALIDYITRHDCPSGAGHSDADYVANIVKDIKAFGHYPAKRHVLITNDFTSSTFRVALQKQLPRLIFATMEGAPTDCTFGLGYVTNYATYAPVRFAHEGNGHPALIPTKRPPKFKLIVLAQYKDTYEFKKAQRHPTYSFQDRASLFESNRANTFPWPVFIATPIADKPYPGKAIPRCREIPFNEIMIPTSDTVTGGRNTTAYAFDRCSTKKRYSRPESQHLRELSEFEVLLRGDTAGGDRWMNAMASPNAPIMIAVGDSALDALGWLPFQKIIKWESFVVVLERKKFRENPVKELVNVVETMSLSEKRRRRNLMRKHHADIDWGAHNTRMTDNFLRAALECTCGGYV